MIDQERICGNCRLFVTDETGVKAIEVGSGKKVASGRRNCSAGNVAWATSTCPTGEFKKKQIPEPQKN